jgi:hypothetical protein
MRRRVGDRYLAKNLWSSVIESMRACLSDALESGGSLGQWEVIFLQSSTVASWQTLGVLAVRRWWTSAGTTCESRASCRICSSACRRASLSGIKNWINISSSQPPDLLLRLSTCVVIRHQKLDQQQLQRLRHSSHLMLILVAAWWPPFTATRHAGGGGGDGLAGQRKPYRFGGVVARGRDAGKERRGRGRDAGKERRGRERDCRKEDGAGRGWSGGTVRLVDALAPALRCSRD